MFGNKLKFSRIIFLLCLLAGSCTLPVEPEPTSPPLVPADTELPATPAPTAESLSEPTTTETPEPEIRLQTEHQAVLFVDGQGLDTYFNRVAWEAVLSVGERYGMLVELVTWDDPDTVGTKMTEMIDAGYTIILTNGFSFAEVTRESAALYPEVKFIGIDQFESPEPYDNLMTLYFDVWDAGFKAGALAAMLTESGVVWGAHGLADNPVVVSYGEGFAAGVAYIDSNIQVVSVYYDGDGFAYGDPEWAAAQAEGAISAGADVLFSAAGMTSIAMMESYANNEGKYCIGVDIDQWEAHPELHSCLVTSAIKRIDSTLEEVLSYAVEDKFISGPYKGEGGLAPFHDFEEVIREEIRGKLNEIQMMMYTGEIQP